MRQCTCGRSITYPYCDNTHKTKVNSEDLTLSSTDNNIRETILLKMKESDKTGKVLFLKGFMSQSPEWGDFVGLINHQYNNPIIDEVSENIYDESKKEEHGDHGPKILLNNNNKSTNMYSLKKLDLHVLRIKQINFSIQTPSFEHSWYNMPYLDNFLSIFYKQDMLNTVKSLINFAGNEYVGTGHSDRQSVVSWTCAGEVEYRIYHIKNSTERDSLTYEQQRTLTYDSYIMKPGDVMYIPIGVFHSAVANFPRASLILDYDVLNTQG
jgi:hypothetical protein